MNLLLTMRVALRALGKNKLRAGLTVLGVVIGIAAVTTMVSLGQSASELVQGQLQSFGTNLIVIAPGSRSRQGVRQGRGTSHTLTAQDSDAMARECPSVLAASPIVGAMGQVIYGNLNWTPKEIHGAGADYLTVRNWQIRHGGYFTERDVAAAAKVCVIGHTIVEKLFQTANPIGESIRIRNIPLEVIGVLETKGANMVGEDQDNIIILPFSTVRKRLQGSSFANVDVILASARSVHRMAAAEHEIRQLLFERHRISPGDSPDFEVKNTTEVAIMLDKITGILTLLLVLIAGISLVVGGVGIMNIMLVSVTERTREIGIRLAVGARGKDILRQFLIESTVLSCLGGAVGILLGAGASAGLMWIINMLTKGSQWPVVVSFRAAIVAMIIAGAVGVFFGYYPARRASRLDPIECLRYE